MTSETKPIRRHERTAAAADPPTIGWDVARIAACGTWVSNLLDCCSSITAHAAVDLILPSLRRKLRARLADAVVAGAVDVIVKHIAMHHDGAAVHLASIGRDALARRCREQFDATRREDCLTTAVATAVAAGVDGEKISWEAITRESGRHEGLINKECNRLVRVIPNRTADDLKGYGWAGLRMALRNFDPSLGWTFSTYACPKINGAIRDGARSESHLPKRLTTFVRKVAAAKEQLGQDLGRAPTIEEVAAFLKVEPAQLEMMPRLSPAASIEELATNWDGDSPPPDCLVDRSAPEDAALTSLRDKALRDAVASLPCEERQAVQMLMLDDIPATEAAAIVGVDTRQLRLRKQRGLQALEPLMRSWMAPALVAA